MLKYHAIHDIKLMSAEQILAKGVLCHWCDERHISRAELDELIRVCQTAPHFPELVTGLNDEKCKKFL